MSLREFFYFQKSVYSSFLDDLSQALLLRSLDQEIRIYEVEPDHFRQYDADCTLSGRRHSDQYQICSSHFSAISFFENH